MKQEISFYDFCDAFGETRKNQFSYEGKKALFEYLEQYEEDTEQNIDLDIIALCCEYCEYKNIEEYLMDYNTNIDKTDFNYNEKGFEFEEDEFNKAVLEEIENKTTLIKIDGQEGFIIQCY